MSKFPRWHHFFYGKNNYYFFHKKNFVTSVRYVLKLLIPDFRAFLTPIFHLFMSSGCILSAFLMPPVYLELGLTHSLRSYFNNIFSSLMNTSHFYNWYLIFFKKNLPFCSICPSFISWISSFSFITNHFLHNLYPFFCFEMLLLIFLLLCIPHSQYYLCFLRL